MSSTRLNHKGFTLIEVLVAAVAGVLVLGGIYQLLMQSQKIYKFQSQVAEMQQNLRIAMDTMVRDIRQAGSDPTRSIFSQTNLPCTLPAPAGLAVRVQMDLPRDFNSDGDTWDITGMGTGPTHRTENEIGNGTSDDVSPDEDITYQYCPEGAAAVGICPANAGGQIYRQVNALGTNVTEPFADFIDLPAGVPMFTRPANEVIVIYLRGRTRDRDPQSHQFRYMELRNEIQMPNL